MRLEDVWEFWMFVADAADDPLLYEFVEKWSRRVAHEGGQEQVLGSEEGSGALGSRSGKQSREVPASLSRTIDC